MGDHDGWYKRLFSHKELVEGLVRGFVQEPWVDELDFGTLALVNSSHVGDKLERRETDAVWRIDFRGQPLYVCLLLEFQSTVDRTMALRVLAYVALLYQELDRKGEHIEGGKLPPVVPIVLYNGEPRWTAAREVSELIAPGPPELAAWRPRLSYLLIDEHRRAADPVARENLAAAVFRFEASRSEPEVDEILAAVAPALSRESVRRTVLDWLALDLMPDRLPGTPRKPRTVEELRKMLQQRRRTFAEMAEERGLKEGLQKGRRQGEARLLERQLTHRFGPLPKDVRERLAAASSRKLLEWGERCLTADSLEAVFAD